MTDAGGGGSVLVPYYPTRRPTVTPTPATILDYLTPLPTVPLPVTPEVRKALDRLWDVQVREVARRRQQPYPHPTTCDGRSVRQ